MGASASIGRVGGLAVALGVGTAIATGHGVASAETTDSTSSTSSDSSSADSSSTGTSTGSTTSPATGSSTTTQTSDTSKASEASEADAGTTSNTVAPGVVSAQTNTGRSGGTDTTETPDEPDTPDDSDTEEAPPTETAAPEPEPEPEPTTGTEEPAEEPTETPAAPEDPAPVAPSSSTNDSSTSPTAPTQTESARTVEAPADAATTIPQADTVAMFADARALAAASPTAVSPMVAAQAAQTTEPAAPVTVAPQNPLAVVTNVVSTVINWALNPLAGTSPTAPAQPPLMWALLAFARREVEGFFAALSGRSSETAAQSFTGSIALAAAAAINPRPAFPVPGQQLSPSTSFVDWITGNYPPNSTADRFGIWGTDLGIMWDNGMVDDPATPWNEHQVLIAVGDTFSGPNMSGIWRFNTLLRSSDVNLADGMSIPDGEWFNGNMFGGAPLSSPTFARQIIHSAAGLPTGITLIPTAGISLPTPGTQFGVTQYVHFMSVTQWGAAGQWTTNYSALAYSTDNGENWSVAPTSVRYNQPWSGNQNFQQAAFVRPGDGYVYMYGTPNGRQGAAYVSRVLENDILNMTKYEYYSKGKAGWFGFGSTPAGWYMNNPAAATPVFGQDQGACGVAKAGNQVSEMSVQYNTHLNKYVVLHGDQFNNIVMRTSDTPQGTWSTAKVLMAQQNGGIYAPMMHPWSPSTMGTGTDLYWNLSLWSEYNVMLMRTDLTKV